MMLFTYHQLAPEKVFTPQASHRLTFSKENFWKSEKDFQDNAADPTCHKFAFMFKNSYIIDGKRDRVVANYHGNREMVLIDSRVYLRLTAKEVKGKGQSAGFKLRSWDGRIEILLRYIGESTVHGYKATKVLRQFMGVS